MIEMLPYRTSDMPLKVMCPNCGNVKAYNGEVEFMRVTIKEEDLICPSCGRMMGRYDEQGNLSFSWFV